VREKGEDEAAGGGKRKPLFEANAKKRRRGGGGGCEKFGSAHSGTNESAGVPRELEKKAAKGNGEPGAQ